MKYKAVVATLIASLWIPASAGEITTPDGFDLSRLYEKFKGSVTRSDAEQIMYRDFNAALGNGTPPAKLFAYARKGNPTACNLVGYLFDAGKGVKQDSQKAAKWFSYCATKNPMAAYNLATLYAEGRGIEKDMTKAEPYFKIAWNGLQQPQAAIRLAYWYRSTRNWSSEWEWLERLEKAQKYPRHWGYLMGEMIINKVAPIYDPSKANAVLNLALEQHSPQAADLLAHSLGVGLEGAPDHQAACQLEMLSSMFSGKAPSSLKWQAGMDDEEISKCRTMASSWITNHKKPEALDFKSLIY